MRRKKPIPATVRKELKERLAQFKSRQQASRASGISTGCLSEIASGKKREISEETAVSLAEFLGHDPRTLFGVEWYQPKATSASLSEAPVPASASRGNGTSSPVGIANGRSATASKPLSAVYLGAMGENGSREREHATAMARFIRGALGTSFDLKVPHEMHHPGSIKEQIGSVLEAADLVLADLTYVSMPTAYEIHWVETLQKPLVIIRDQDGPHMFYVTGHRELVYRNSTAGTMRLMDLLQEAVPELIAAVQERALSNDDTDTRGAAS